MRLIDADKLEEHFRKVVDYYENGNFIMGKLKRKLLEGVFRDVLERIKSQPTAYDSDKVVKKIRNLPHGAVLNVELEDEIIGIVKAGGVE